MCRTHFDADIFMLNLNKTLLYSLACDLKIHREMYHRDICEFYKVHNFMLQQKNLKNTVIVSFRQFLNGQKVKDNRERFY